MLQIEKSIQKLRKSVKDMTELVLKMSETVNNAIHRNKGDLEIIFEHDKHLDILEKETDMQAVELLALINPRATDLRFVFSVIKLDVDLERIGDECKNVARELRSVEPPFPEELGKLSGIVHNMLEDVFKALITSDSHLAREVVIRDDEADKVEYAILKKYSNSIGLCFAAKALERMADHATNIAEKVVFTVEGVDIRHENSMQTRHPKE